jgi:transcriptional regulator with XRE-family HTH domain
LPEVDIEGQIGARIRALRTERSLTLEGLAERAAVSRAMLSRIERGESSPTAQLLGKVCAGLGVSLSVLFATAEPVPNPIRRRTAQPIWRDPASGYVRRNIAPDGTGSPVDISEIELPPAARVAFDSLRLKKGDQHIWVLDGSLELTIGAQSHRLEAGDCIHMRFDLPVTFRNPTRRPVRYAVVISYGGAG